ncbi:MAG: hypothetical protein FJY98_04440 [Candidatus Liptonbacteria bacterium]|nr:hypothetical protein [Candidatus Liptonbacteria bacterium]
MVTDQLRAYVKTQLGKGIAPEAVKAALLKAGWQAPDVEEVMGGGSAPQAPQPAAPAIPSASTPPITPSFSSTPAEPLKILETSPAAASPTLITPTDFTAPKTEKPQPTVSDISPVPASITKINPFAAISSQSTSTGSDLGSNPSLQLPVEKDLGGVGMGSVAQPEMVSINPEPSVEKTPIKPKSSPFVIGLLLLVIGASAGLAYWFLTTEDAPPAPAVVEEAPVAVVPEVPEIQAAVATMTAPVEDPDITAAKETFEIIRKANATKDATLEKQYLSKQTLSTIASSPNWKPVWYKDFELANAVKEGGIVVMTIISIKENAATSSAETVFVKEDGVWKLGIAETLQRLQLKKTATSTPATATSTKPVSTSTTQ